MTTIKRGQLNPPSKAGLDTSMQLNQTNGGIVKGLGIDTVLTPKGKRKKIDPTSTAELANMLGE